jgi:uncharacterized membrane protein YqjE
MTMARSTPNPPSSSAPDGGFGASEAGNGNGSSAVTLLRRLVDDLSTLVRKELALATAEISQSLHSVQKGVASVAVGGAVCFAGFLFLLVAATAALAQTMDTWLAALIVGAIVAIVGYSMLAAGKKKLEQSDLKLKRTQESLHQDRELIKGRTQ